MAQSSTYNHHQFGYNYRIAVSRTLWCIRARSIALGHGSSSLKKSKSNHQVWNIACDLAINQLVAGKLPEGALMDFTFWGRSPKYFSPFYKVQVRNALSIHHGLDAGKRYK